MENLNKTYDQVLDEANDFFQAQGMSIIGDGYKEIASNASAFESYVDTLTEGCSADETAAMTQLMVNTNNNILHESSITGIQPIASLSMPVIRKLWPKFALKEAIPTEVAKTPRFVISYTAPYLYKGDGERIYLPRGLHDAKDAYEIPGALQKEFTAEHRIELTAGAAKMLDFTKTDGGAEDEHVVIKDTPSHAKLQPLDELVFVEAWLAAATGDAGKDKKAKHDGEGTTEGAEDVGSIVIGKRLGVYGNAVYPVKLKDGREYGQLIVQFDGANRKATFAFVKTIVEQESAATNYIVTLKVKAGVSSEYNEESWSVGFDIKRQDIDIPTGQHINAPLPIESLNDMMALYQIDGTKETVDLMTNVFAQKLDEEILRFLIQSHVNQPSNEAFADYPGASEFTFSFDCKPAAGFAGSPKAWREELKPLIDTLAQKIRNNTYLSQGVFTIIGNPLDIQILANVDWQFRGGQGAGVDGVNVDYSVGTYTGANAYKVVSSMNVPAGQMFLVFAPSGNTQMTYKYYPYAFSTEMGYTDPNRSRTPSIMMTKRDTLHEFMPAIGMILILNNDGKGYFRTAVPYEETK